MKSTIIFSCFAFFLLSCNPFKTSNTFDSEKLKGKYKVDVSSIIEQANKTSKKDKNNDTWSNLGKGIASLAFSTINIEMTFYDNNKGVISMDGGILNSFLNSEDRLTEFSYKVEDDSIIYFKSIKDNDFKKWAIIKKYSDSYDYLQFLIVEEGKENVYFNLRKIN